MTPLSVVERPLGARARQWAALLVVAVAAVLADQLTKGVVARRLPLGDEVDVAGPFAIHHVQNSGIAFGLLANAVELVIALTCVAVAWMLVFFARSGARHPVVPVALGLVIGGSVSNLADRIRQGHVTDFLDLRFWPAFNLADTFIVTGVLVLLGALLVADRAPRTRPVPAEAPASRS